MKSTSRILWAAIGAVSVIGLGAFAKRRYPNQPLGASLRAAGHELMELAGPLLEDVVAAQKQARHTARDLGGQAQEKAHQAIDSLDRGYGQAHDVLEDKAVGAREALGATAKAVQEKAQNTVHAVQETVQDSAVSAKETLLAAKDQASSRMSAIIEPILESGAALKEQLQNKRHNKS